MVRTKQTTSISRNNDPRDPVLARKLDAIINRTKPRKIPDSNEENFFKKQKTKKKTTGSIALREIKKYSKTTEPLIRKMPFQRVVREIAQDLLPKDSVMCYRFQSDALDALQIATETLISEIFMMTNALTHKCKRETITIGDMHFMMALKDSLSTIYSQMAVNATHTKHVAAERERMEKMQAEARARAAAAEAVAEKKTYPKKAIIPDE